LPDYLFITLPDDNENVRRDGVLKDNVMDDCLKRNIERENNDNRLKILFIPAWYPSSSYPINGVFIREHAKAASLYNDIKVIYVCPDSSLQWYKIYQISTDLEERISTTRVHYNAINQRIKNKFKNKNVNSTNSTGKKSYIYKLLSIPRTIWQESIYLWCLYTSLRTLIKNGWKPDVIHAHIYSAGLGAVILGKVFKIPVIITEHWSIFPRHLLSSFQRFKCRYAMNAASILLPVSENLMGHIKTYGINNKYYVVPNTVDTGIFTPLPSDEIVKKDLKRILLVARLVPVKGIPYLFQALSRLKIKRQDFKLDIVGDGTNRDEYQELTKSLEIEDIVEFHGIKNRVEVAEYMSNCDFYVQPSLWENLPTVLIEVTSCGKPVIATNVGGVNEIINENNGILIPPKDIEAIYKAMEYMLDNYSKYSSDIISQSAKKRFGYKNVGKTLDNIYRELVSKNMINVSLVNELDIDNG